MTYRLAIPLLLMSAPLAHAQGFTTNVNGFTAPNGQAWVPKGMNVDLSDALQNLQGIEKNYPGTNFVRLVTVADRDSVSSIAPVVQAYTAKGITVEIEDHGDSQGGGNTGWYSSVASTFKNNPYVFLETPNEPSAANTVQNQINIINAIRATGFSNPIGIQPIGGWDESNIPQVAGAVGTSNLYVTPHVYYNGTDPNGAAGFVQAVITQAAQNGMYSIIDEFGNALDGFTLDPLGASDVQAVIAANLAGKAGAAIWAAGNGYHPDGADSLFLDPTGSQLSPLGQEVLSWFSGSAPSMPSMTLNGIPTSAGLLPKTDIQAGPRPSCSNATSPTVQPVPAGSITPGKGAVNVGGNTYTIDTSSDEVLRNGTPATPNGTGSETSAVTTIDGALYGQDENTTQWFRLDGSGWTPLQNLPQSGQAVMPTSRWTTPPPPATAEGMSAMNAAAGTEQQSQSFIGQQQSILCELEGGLARLLALQSAQGK